MNSVRDDELLFNGDVVRNVTYMFGCVIEHVSGHTYESQIGERFWERTNLWYMNLYTGKYNCKFGIEITYCNTSGFNTGW